MLLGKPMELRQDLLGRASLSHRRALTVQRQMIFLIGVWNLARLSTFSMGNLTRTPVNSPRSRCPHQDVLTAIGRCRAHRDPCGPSSAIFAHSSARLATTLS